MNMFYAAPLTIHTAAQAAWLARVFDAKAVEKGGVIRRSVASVEREIGHKFLADEVRRRGFHLIRCGDQFVIICNTGHLQIIA